LSFIARMLPLKKKTIWKKEIRDDEKSALTVRIEKEQVISEDSMTPGRITRTVEICSPAEDRRGQAIKKRMRITIDSAVLRDMGRN
jgi:hypothetical protein